MSFELSESRAIFFFETVTDCSLSRRAVFRAGRFGRSETSEMCLIY